VPNLFNIVLFEPEIPPNTGNIIRLCANTGTQLHLIHPLGFDMNDKALRRAGLDYHEWANVREYPDLGQMLEQNKKPRCFAISTKGTASHTQPHYKAGDTFIFGPETRGLPNDVLDSFPSQQIIRIPMLAQSRSLNLSNAAAIILYEAWRQVDFQQ
jgi:tRNA (cytidine/uridine-2'-O-)-methyltransferase